MDDVLRMYATSDGGPFGKPGDLDPGQVEAFAEEEDELEAAGILTSSDDDEALPTAASSTGLIFYFKKIDATTNLMTIKGNGAELIDGVNVQSTSVQYTSFTVISDGTQWSIL